MPRTEYHCKLCVVHQVRVFDGVPRISRKRYCNNGAALNFISG